MKKRTEYNLQNYVKTLVQTNDSCKRQLKDYQKQHAHIRHTIAHIQSCLRQRKLLHSDRQRRKNIIQILNEQHKQLSRKGAQIQELVSSTHPLPNCIASEDSVAVVHTF